MQKRKLGNMPLPLAGVRVIELARILPPMGRTAVSPISAQTSSRSSARSKVMIPASGVRRSSAQPREKTSVQPISIVAIVASARLQSISRRRKAKRKCARLPRMPTCSSKISRWAGWRVTGRRGGAASAQSEVGLLLYHRFRPNRSVRTSSRIRFYRPGNGWNDVHHR